MLLSIILVNYNGSSYLDACLESVKRFSPPDTEVIMVDNASADGSGELVTREYPWVHLIKNERNLGFAAGNNLAAARVTGRFMLLLNTDTVLLEPLAAAVKWLEEHPKCGILTIGMVDGEHVPRACTGRFPTAARLMLLRTMLVNPDNYDGLEASEVDWVQGSFLLIRTELWNSLDGFDEQYFMYVEDVDLCRRARDSGFSCVLLPRMRYVHIGGFNVTRFPDQVVNLARYIEQHMKGIKKLCCRGSLFFGCMARVGWYQLLAILMRDDASRRLSNVCRQALEKLLSAHIEVSARTSGGEL